MHEVALAQAIVDIVAEQALRERFHRVTRVRVALGDLSHVMQEALLAGFQSASLGTPAENARLELLRSPGRAWCMDCSQEVTVPARLASCPTCGGAKLVVTSGDEMRVVDLEVS